MTALTLPRPSRPTWRAYRPPIPSRLALDKAFALVAGGHVFPLEDGRSASSAARAIRRCPIW